MRDPSKIHTTEARERYYLLKCQIEIYSKKSMDGMDIIVDCGLGIGSHGSIREPYKSFIMDVNKSDIPILSIDVPSGFGTNIAVIPRYTITFNDIKIGMNNKLCGDIIIMDIGVPKNAIKYTGPGDMLRYPIPSKNSHKGDNGRVMIISGGPYFGAPIMSAMAALRTGADTITIFTPYNVSDIVSSYCPVLIVRSMDGDHLIPDHVNRLLEDSSRYSAVLIGPGLGRSHDTIDAIREFVTRCATPMVIDADGLTAICGMKIHHPTVLTPHKAEFMGLDLKHEGIVRVSMNMNATILLKGSIDIITNGKKTRFNKHGTPAMTGAGTGDVLSGIVVALLSKGLSTMDAACLGSYICGVSGEYVFRDKSYGLIATDIVDAIPHSIKSGLDNI